MWYLKIKSAFEVKFRASHQELLKILGALLHHLWASSHHYRVECGAKEVMEKIGRRLTDELAMAVRETVYVYGPGFTFHEYIYQFMRNGTRHGGICS